MRRSSAATVRNNSGMRGVAAGPVPNGVRNGHTASHDGTRLDIFGNARLCDDCGVIPDVYMVDHANLTRQRHVRAQAAAARDANLCQEQVILTDLDVMGDMDQVVDLRTATDERLSYSGAVDAQIGTDFHIIFNAHPTDLWDFQMVAIWTRYIAIPIGPDHRTRVDDHSLANRHVIVDGHVGI